MPSSSELLQQFSVSEDEAEIYLALLKIGTATVSEIAKKIDKNRTATYFHIKKLIRKKLLCELHGGRIQKFTTISPAELAERFDRLTTDFKSLVPQLEASQNIDKEAPRIQVSESRSGYYKVYDEISSLPENSTFLAIEGVEALKNELTSLSNDDTANFYSKMIERNIAVRLIITQEASEIPNALITEENLKLLRKRSIDVRTHTESVLPFQGLSLMYADTVAYLFPKTKLVVMIKHQGIADSFRATFNVLSHFGKPYQYSD